MQRLQDVKRRWRSPLTWKKLEPAARKAQAYLKDKVTLDGRPFTIETFRKYPEYLSAAVSHAYANSSAIGAVSTPTTGGRTGRGPLDAGCRQRQPPGSTQDRRQEAKAGQRLLREYD